MKKSLVIILLLAAVAINSFTQAKKAFHMVVLPDSITSKLVKYLQEKEKLPGADYPMYVFNLVDSKDYKYKDGIYAFRLTGPHYKRRIFIVNSSQIYIFDGYYFDDLLQEFNEYVKRAKLSTLQKIIYLNAISHFLAEEYKANTSVKFALSSLLV